MPTAWSDDVPDNEVWFVYPDGRYWKFDAETRELLESGMSFYTLALLD